MNSERLSVAPETRASTLRADYFRTERGHINFTVFTALKKIQYRGLSTLQIDPRRAASASRNILTFTRCGLSWAGSRRLALSERVRWVHRECGIASEQIICATSLAFSAGVQKYTLFADSSHAEGTQQPSN
jgi:hypothetical protein